MNPQQRLLLLFALLALSTTGAHAQWLNYPTPGTPRTPDGKPNLIAPVPRAADGKPDLSGVWRHPSTSLAEMKRLFGDNVGLTSVPGMEPDTVNKYALNIFMDVKPAEVPCGRQPRRSSAGARPSTNSAESACPSASPPPVWSRSPIRSFNHPG